MDHRFVKSAAGRDEVTSKSRPLSRSARNLLLLIDASKPAANWVALINGATEADLQLLVAEGLLVAVAAPAVAAASAAARRERPQVMLQQALDGMSYQQLYDLLTHQAKERFGLIKGYKMVLEVERCSDLAALQALAVRLVEQVQEAQGEAAARQMRSALGCAA